MVSASTDQGTDVGALHAGAVRGIEGEVAYGDASHVPVPCISVPACLCSLWARILEVPSGLSREGLFRTAASRDSRLRVRAIVDAATGCGLPDDDTIEFPADGGAFDSDSLGREGSLLLRAMRHIGASPVACAGEIKSLLRDLPRRLLDPSLDGQGRKRRAAILRNNQAQLGKELSAMEAGLAMLEHKFNSESDSSASQRAARELSRVAIAAVAAAAGVDHGVWDRL